MYAGGHSISEYGDSVKLWKMHSSTPEFVRDIEDIIQEYADKNEIYM